MKSAGATRTEEKYCYIKDCEVILVADINVNSLSTKKGKKLTPF